MITRGIVYLILVLIFYLYCKEEKREMASNEKVEVSSDFLEDGMVDLKAVEPNL